MDYRSIVAGGAALFISIAAALAQGAPQLALSASFAGDTKPIPHGITWRVFQQETEGEPRLVTQSQDAAPVLPLPPGEYIVHMAYGLASATRKVLVGNGTTTEKVPINAGALIVKGSILDQVIPLNRLQISVFIPQAGDSEARLVTSSLRAGEVLRLPEGTYHVVSSYGDSNSIVRADIRIASGKITEAKMRHRAATITLKLVSNPGGEARANTAWSVLTPGGDVIREAIGAFPSMTLAEGEYVAIARNEGRVFQNEFKVKSGLDRDIEVLARDGVLPDAVATPQQRPPAPPAAPRRP
ncbi:MAG: hypothetical protein IOC90_16895 [Methylocystis sp.]|jgi:hypothetical protein|nr:hypothetical protein [Methylocystis sp.]MCA3583545.1 hypothetical protein [Methylocystis sp.]MCA3589687.1 hypothetical protein [Methylocystis sp.]MCA3592146.1 hypothetical protein [Methylocystis sp.]